MIMINLNDLKSFSSFRVAGLKQNPQFDDSAGNWRLRLGYIGLVKLLHEIICRLRSCKVVGRN